jgi:hypothetical protein
MLICTRAMTPRIPHFCLGVQEYPKTPSLTFTGVMWFGFGRVRWRDVVAWVVEVGVPAEEKGVVAVRLAVLSALEVCLGSKVKGSTEMLEEVAMVGREESVLPWGRDGRSIVELIFRVF